MKNLTCAITGKECDKPDIATDTKPCNCGCEIGQKWLKENNNVIFHDEK